MDQQNLLSKKNIILFFTLLVIIISIPVGVYLIQRQQQLKSKAQVEPIIFQGTDVDCANIECTTSSTTVDVKITAPFPHESITGSGGSGSVDNNND